MFDSASSVLWGTRVPLVPVQVLSFDTALRGIRESRGVPPVPYETGTLSTHVRAALPAGFSGTFVATPTTSGVLIFDSLAEVELYCETGVPGGLETVSLLVDSLGGSQGSDLDLLMGVRRYLRALQENTRPSMVWREAWEEFYGTYDPIVRQVVVAGRVAAADVEDCRQDAWTEIIARLSTVEEGFSHPQFEEWLRRLLRRKISQCRYHSNALAARFLSGRLVERACDRALRPDCACERRELQRAVRAALSRLYRQISRMSRRVLRMRSLKEYSVAEVADRLGLTTDEVRRYHHRALRKLRRFIEASLRNF